MMEWNEIGIKDTDDVRRCLAEGATVAELRQTFGARIEPLLENLEAEAEPEPEPLHTIACDNTDRELCDCADYPPPPEPVQR